jgi:hypothetical protein
MKAEITSMTARTNAATLPTCCWNDINEPGCYLFTETGCLVRVPNEAIGDGHSPKITFCGTNNPTVCKLSDDPYLTLSRARQIAADNDCTVCF